MDEVCSSCHQEYHYTKETCTLHLFIDDQQCNHIETKCTHCGQIERVYARANHFLGVMNELGAGVSLHVEATDDLRTSAARTWAAYDKPEEADELPEAPKDQLRQLYDDLRNWRGEEL